jgi:hypothetical protein
MKRLIFFSNSLVIVDFSLSSCFVGHCHLLFLMSIFFFFFVAIAYYCCSGLSLFVDGANFVWYHGMVDCIVNVDVGISGEIGTAGTVEPVPISKSSGMCHAQKLNIGRHATSGASTKVTNLGQGVVSTTSENYQGPLVRSRAQNC